MGLDTVELIMAVEEEFALAIPNQTAATLETVGDIHRFVLAFLRERGEATEEAMVWERVRQVVIRELAVLPEEVVPAAHIVYDLHAD